jgi:hypothetical protein
MRTSFGELSTYTAVITIHPHKRHIVSYLTTVLKFTLSDTRRRDQVAAPPRNAQTQTPIALVMAKFERNCTLWMLNSFTNL